MANSHSNVYESSTDNSVNSLSHDQIICGNPVLQSERVNLQGRYTGPSNIVTVFNPILLHERNVTRQSWANEDVEEINTPEDHILEANMVNNHTLAQKETKNVASGSWDKLAELDILRKKLNKDPEKESKKEHVTLSTYQGSKRKMF